MLLLSFIVADGRHEFKYEYRVFLSFTWRIDRALTVSGSNRAFAEWAQNKIKGRRGAKLLAASFSVCNLY